MAKVYKTPGVYQQEINTFPNSVVPVATAVPAFIGYTEKAERDRQPLLLKPTRISSYGEYLQFFGGPARTTFELAPPGKDAGAYRLTAPKNYFTLYNHLKLFFANGGSDCYIVSVGGYATEEDPDKKIEIEELLKGLPPLEKEPEPTMIVIPETMETISGESTPQKIKAQIAAIYPEILEHCAKMENRFAILDCWMDRAQYATETYDPSQDISQFREGVGTNQLEWGASYFPWLHTTAVPFAAISFANIRNLGTEVDILPLKVKKDGKMTDDALKQLRQDYDKKLGMDQDGGFSLVRLLDKTITQEVINKIIPPLKAFSIKTELKKLTGLNELDDAEQQTLHQTLLAVSPLYKTILATIQKELNLLPPSAAMAGVYSMVDNNIGVWQSPANVSVGSVIKPAVEINNEQQEDMNLPLNGKAVNAIRSFPGKGVLVWGARTLDGNSQDWRYISVRRTLIFIEQSIKIAAEAYVFQPNTAETWTTVKSMISNFLNNVWQQGALAGASAEEAFSVDVGLGVTMTSVDILEGIMRVTVKLAVTRPGEFIVITFQQRMQTT